MPPITVDLAAADEKETQECTHNACSNLDAFSSDDLAVISHILMAILHANNFQDLLETMHSALNRLHCVDGLAIYRVSDHERGFQTAFQAGECRNHIPDIIPQTASLFKSIAQRKLIDVITARCPQPSLFDDLPLAMFCPLVVDEHLIGALAIVHRALDIRFVSAVLNEAAIALELLCKADTFANTLSIRAHFGSEKRIKQEPEIVDTEDGYAKLTPREKEVLALLSQGLSNKELASDLFISAATCKHHVENILAKLNLHNRTAAVAVGLAHQKS